MNNSKANLRPVILRNGQKGYFHCWGQCNDGELAETLGVVELEDGTCNQYSVSFITFTDRNDK